MKFMLGCKSRPVSLSYLFRFQIALLWYFKLKKKDCHQQQGMLWILQTIRVIGQLRTVKSRNTFELMRLFQRPKSKSLAFLYWTALFNVSQLCTYNYLKKRKRKKNKIDWGQNRIKPQLRGKACFKGGNVREVFVIAFSTPFYSYHRKFHGWRY